MNTETDTRFYGRTHDFAQAALKTSVNAVFVLVIITYIFPFLWLLYTSLKTQKEFMLNIFSLPSGLFTGNYLTILKTRDVLNTFFNSFFNSFVSMVIITIMSFLLAYFLTRYTFRGRNLLYGFFLLGMIIPIHALLIPLFIQFNILKILNKRYTLLLPYVTFHLPVSIYLFSSYIKTIPKELEEAAYIDGSSINNTIFKIIFPICMPITATVLILSFLGLWNEFPFALILLTRPVYRTVPIWLTFFEGQYTVDYPLKLTAMFLASFPVIVLYLIFREKIIKGMAAGAIKG